MKDKKITDFFITLEDKEKFKKKYSFAISRNVAYDPLTNTKRNLKCGGLMTGVYNGTFVEEVWIEPRPMGSIRGFDDW